MKQKNIKNVNKKNVDHIELDDKQYHFFKEDSEFVNVHFSNTNTIENPYKHVMFKINDKNELIIDGNSAKLIFHGDINTFLIENSKNITIKNLTIDYFKPTAVELYVKSVNEKSKYVDYKISKTFNYEIDGKDIIWKSEKSLDGYYWKEKNNFNSYAVTIFDLKNKYSKRLDLNEGPFSNQIMIKKIDEGIRVYYNKIPKSASEDYIICLNESCNRDNAGFSIIESKNIKFENVTFNYLHGFGLLLQMCENVVFDNCKFVGNDRHMVTSFADSIHVSGLKGKIEIKNCVFDSSLDDSINIHGTYVRVENVEKNKAIMRYVHHQQGGFNQFFVGDEVDFFDRNSLKRVGNKSYKVVDVINPGEYSKDLQYMEVYFDEDLPDYLNEKMENEGKYVAENISYTPEVLIENNKFSNIPTRAILCTTRKKSIIRNNIFENITMASIYLSNDANEWYESGKIEDMLIENNIFKYNEEFLRLNDTKSIWINPILKYENNDVFIHKNIKIINNKFEIKKEKAIIYKNTSNIFMDENVYKK
ncbi:hypothetical protein ABGF48_01175 [Helcococcus bovis]|uniref:alpha-1,3-galactosidase-related protein n=1 Tax=Helcococcus bovis TaxID=3153252 RepID=UPI0038B8273F